MGPSVLMDLGIGIGLRENNGLKAALREALDFMKGDGSLDALIVRWAGSHSVSHPRAAAGTGIAGRADRSHEGGRVRSWRGGYGPGLTAGNETVDMPVSVVGDFQVPDRNRAQLGFAAGVISVEFEAVTLREAAFKWRETCHYCPLG